MCNFSNKALKSVFLASLLSILGGLNLQADQIAVNSFKYLNSNENPTIIDSAEAQDLLNVDITPGGKSVKKRAGYGLYKRFNDSTGMHGGYHAFDATGNDYQLWGSSTALFGIVADATPIQLISSATLNSTWDCADTQGFSYCVTSNRDAYIKTNGTTMTWLASPLGTMVESTPDRVVVAGVSASPNTLFVSQSNNFTNFTTGVNTTDPFNEVIAAPGSKLTHIRWGCGKLLWWKDASFGWFDFDDQYSAQVKTISDTVGTFDNTSAIDPGGNVYFRGQDGHIWKYDCSGLSKETLDITPQIQASGKRTTNSWTQSSQADFQTGASSPTTTLSTTISIGDVVPSSFTKTETSSASGWGSGTSSNLAVGTSSISILTNNLGTATNPDFESAFAGNWTDSAGTTPITKTASVAGTCTLNPQSGSAFASDNHSVQPITVAELQIIDLSNNVLASKGPVGVPTDCAWTQFTVLSSASAGKRVKFRFHTQWGGSLDEYLTTTDSYIFGGSATFYQAGVATAGGVYYAAFDNVQSGSSTIATGSFASQALYTGTPYSFIFASATWTTNGLTPSFVLQKSANGSTGWSDVSTSTGVNVQTNLPYLRYLSTFTVVSEGNALGALQGVNILTRSSGTYFSAVKNAPNLSAWSTFNPTWIDNGDDINFAMRSSTSPFYVLNSSPPWITQSASALVSIATGTYFQMVATFTVTAATNTPSSLNDFTINWFEGSATDQAYMLYFDNAIWASVAYGTGVSSNTYIFKDDLINNGWTLYDFGAGGMLVQNNHLFFGSVSTGTVFQFGSGTSDNGNAINSYWKSKDFTGTDPFLQSQLTQIDTFAKKNQNQALTATYSLDTSTTTTSYSIPLSSATASIIQSRKLLPSGKLGYTFDIKYGDNTTSSAWELFGFRIGQVQQPYRPSQ